MLLVYLFALETEQERHNLTELYEANKAMLLRYALKITSNQEMAEDAVHNTFLSVIKHKETLLSLPNKDFRIRAIIIVKNKCIDLLRRQKAYTDSTLDEIEYDLDSREPAIDDQIIIRDEYDAIRRNINSLDEISRQVLEMKYILGMSYKEIGAKLGMTPKHVGTRIERAKAKVRKLIAQEGKKSEQSKIKRRSF